MKRRELSPLADPVFKRVFGEEKEILMELINAVMQLEHPVMNIEYLPPELLPERIDKKTTVVEMQVARQKSLKKRVLFNAARVYGRQIPQGLDFDELQPVFALCLVDHIIEHDTDRWKHKYIIVNADDPDRCIKEVEMHFIELSKCRKRSNFNLEDSLDRWVKYLIDPEFIKSFTMNTQYDYPNLKKAVELLDESNYTEGQLVAYDKYLDSIRSWNSSMKLSYEEGREEERQLILKIINDLRERISVDEISFKYCVEVSFVEQFIKD
jgi:predicted transposase/invertase (TIGR01784 family)